MRLYTFLKFLIIISLFSCNCNSTKYNTKNQNQSKKEKQINKENLNSDLYIEDIEQAIELIKNYDGNVDEFKLKLKKNLKFEGKSFPFSAGMAVITDQILKKGWTVNGLEKGEKGNIYFYKLME